MRQIIHVDMDAFYAAVEQRDDPTLRGKPVIVGGPSARGVVSTCSYEARPMGVRSAMPMRRALELCPQAIVLPPRMRHYARESRKIMAILTSFSPEIEPLSLDEAFLDVTASAALFGDGAAIAEAIRARVSGELGLTCSAGVASSKFVAKIASEIHKPDGLTVVPHGAEAVFLAPLPVERMWGVGPKTRERLVSLSYRTIGDLAKADPRDLANTLGSSWGGVMAELARGIDARPVVTGRVAKSIGAEETFEHDVSDPATLSRHLLAQSARVAQRLTHDGYVARIIVLKIKYASFDAITRRVTLPEPVADTASIHRAITGLLASVTDLARGVRLTGVSAQGLSPKLERQLGLFGDTKAVRRERLEELVADARKRWGGPVLRVAGASDEDDVRVDE